MFYDQVLRNDAAPDLFYTTLIFTGVYDFEKLHIILLKNAALNLRTSFRPASLLKATDSFISLLFPHRCAGCGSDVLDAAQIICAACVDALPHTHFEHHHSNPIEKIFWGRLPLTHATAQFFFTKGGIMQHLMHELKYRGNRDVGVHLGKIMGAQLAATNRFRAVDALIPLPLYPEKEHKRGYNQSFALCEGIGAILQKPILQDAVIRTHHTESQTKKSRVERWENMAGRFMVTSSHELEGKHLLLVDDVVTTGATLEACGHELLQVADVRLSIATLCCAFG